MGEDVRTEGSRGFDWNTDREVEPGNSGVVCAQCEDDIKMEEECYLLQVVQCQKLGGQMYFYPVKDEFDENDDFLFEPYHFCFECWEDLLTDAKREMQDAPPVEDARSIIECTCCGSGIRGMETHNSAEIPGEYVATYTLLEFERSRRAPAPGFMFGPAPRVLGKSEVLCTYCTAILNEVLIAMWKDFSQAGECIDCIQTRCWRYENCGCTCHEEGDTNE
jgi:hypothetical protein